MYDTYTRVPTYVYLDLSIARVLLFPLLINSDLIFQRLLVYLQTGWQQYV